MKLLIMQSSSASSHLGPGIILNIANLLHRMHKERYLNAHYMHVGRGE
jgi:hypothetical protein